MFSTVNLYWLSILYIVVSMFWSQDLVYIPRFPFGNQRFVFKVSSIINYMRKESEKEWIYV